MPYQCITGFFSGLKTLLQRRSSTVRWPYHWLCACCLLGASLGPSLANTSGEPAPTIQLHQHAGLFTLQTNHAPLQQVLTSLAEHAGFDLRIHGDLGTVQHSGEYHQVTLLTLVRTVTSDYNTVMLYRTDAANPAHKQLAALRIFAPSPTNVTQSTVATQIRAIDRLEGLTQSDVVTSLRDTLRQAHEPRVRVRAVHALEDIGGADIVPHLEAALADQSPLVRAELATAFGNIQHPNALLALGQLLFGDKEPKVRLAALHSLQTRADPAGRSFVQSALQDQSQQVRSLAHEILATWPAQAAH